MMLAFSVMGRVVAGAMELTRNKFPKVVRIETTNHCNAACTFCPRDTIGRDKTFMDQALFEKIVDECAYHGTKLIHLHNFGEPLLDKRLPERIRYAKDQGIRRVKIFSNGALLRGKMAEGLLDAGLDEIKVSLDGADAQEFNELRVGLEHASVLENTRNFRKMRDDRGLTTPRVIAACVTSSDKDKTEEVLDGVVDRIDWSSLHNWAGSWRLFGNKKIRKPCVRVFRTFTVLVNGDVALCCLDHSGRELLGNCQENSIAEIWSNNRYKEIRHAHKTSQQELLPVCDDCSKCYY
ncbi:MAG: radical SAM/SPASM domain-containing protein [Pirellulaceae bacterium]|jgi:radical SAM protein with 4Fe4S-binding SPASM domain